MGHWVMLSPFVLVVVFAIGLGRYPGKIAAKRNHPNKDAIMVRQQSR